MLGGILIEQVNLGLSYSLANANLSQFKIEFIPNSCSKPKQITHGFSLNLFLSFSISTSSSGARKF